MHAEEGTIDEGRQSQPDGTAHSADRENVSAMQHALHGDEETEVLFEAVFKLGCLLAQPGRLPRGAHEELSPAERAGSAEMTMSPCSQHPARPTSPPQRSEPAHRSALTALARLVHAVADLAAAFETALAEWARKAK